MNVSLYPMLDYLGDVEIFSVSRYSFTYKEGARSYPLSVKGEGGNVKIEDLRGIWTLEDSNLVVHGRVAITNGSLLYGPEGITSKSSQLALALSWHSHVSNQRGAEIIGIVEQRKKTYELEFSYEFPPASLRGALSLDIILYVKSPGKPQWDEMIFANRAGLILGVIDRYTLTFEGNGSMFPIYEESLPSEPLWRIVCSFSDAAHDSFEENVYIYLNKAHDCYKFVDIQSPSVNLSMLAEILGDALAAVVETVRSQDKDFACLYSPDQGSVAQALLFFRDKLQWEFDKPETVTRTIRKYLDLQMRGRL